MECIFIVVIKVFTYRSIEALSVLCQREALIIQDVFVSIEVIKVRLARNDKFLILDEFCSRFYVRCFNWN